MSSTHAYVYSTLSCDTKYTNYRQGGGDLKVATGGVLIRGGANMASHHLVTPKGVCTPVTEAQLQILDNDPIFERHKQNGFIKIERKEIKLADAVSDMVGRDESAPITPDDYNADDAANKAPITNSPEGDGAPRAPRPPRAPM